MPTTFLKHDSLTEPVAVDVQREAAGGATFRVTSGDTVLEVVRDGPGVGVVHSADGAQPYHAVRADDALFVWIGGRTYRFEIAQRSARRGTAQAATASVTDLTAPMPGTILDIRIASGDTFAPHQPLVIMESMKMEMTLSAPAAGRVGEVCCRVGELVEMGAILVKLTGAEGADDAELA